MKVNGTECSDVGSWQSDRGSKNPLTFFSLSCQHGHRLHSTHIISATFVDKLILDLFMCSKNQRDLHNLNWEPPSAASSLSPLIDSHSKVGADFLNVPKFPTCDTINNFYSRNTKVTWTRSARSYGSENVNLLLVLSTDLSYIRSV